MSFFPAWLPLIILQGVHASQILWSKTLLAALCSVPFSCQDLLRHETV